MIREPRSYLAALNAKSAFRPLFAERDKPQLIKDDEVTLGQSSFQFTESQLCLGFQNVVNEIHRSVETLSCPAGRPHIPRLEAK